MTPTDLITQQSQWQDVIKFLVWKKIITKLTVSGCEIEFRGLVVFVDYESYIYLPTEEFPTLSEAIDRLIRDPYSIHNINSFVAAKEF